MKTIQGRFTEINGTKIYYEMRGEGKSLLFIHGLPLDSRMWDDQFNELSKNFKVIRFDLAGYGLSNSHNDDFSLSEDIKELLDNLHIKKTTLVGLSVGGKIAIDFTLTYPNMVESLIVASTGLTGWSKESKEKKEFSDQLNMYYKNGEQSNIIDLLTNTWVTGPYRQIDRLNENTRKRFKEMVTNSFSKERGKGRIKPQENNSIDIIDQIKVPTLIMTSEYDFSEFNEIGELLESKMKNTIKVQMKDTAHMMNMEKPNEFNDFILKFLNGSLLESINHRDVTYKK